MKQKHIYALNIILALVAFCLMQVSNANGQKPVKPPKQTSNKPAKTITLNAERTEINSKSSASDPNVEQEFTGNDADAPQIDPVSKTAAGNCKYIVDNYTNYTVEIYINGIHKGSLAGGDEVTFYYTPGSATIYVKAPLSDGSYYYWGPSSLSCSHSPLRFKLEY